MRGITIIKKGEEKMKKLYKKLLAMVLSVTLILGSVPLIAIAQTQETTSVNTNSIPTVANEKAFPIEELPEKRTGNTKTFLMSDGTYMNAVYNEQVHYNENGKWKDIDNSFNNVTDSNGENVIENRENSFKINFSKKAKKNKLVTIKKDQYHIGWSLTDAEKATAKILKNDNDSTSLTSLKNITGSVTYENILNNTDLRYTVTANSVKEDIILKNKNAADKYTFEYEVKNLSYKSNADGTICFYKNDNQNDVVYVLDKLYMYDANGEISGNIQIDLSATKKGFSLTIIPDKEWLADNDRAYPVIIDPTIITEQSASMIKDTTGVNSAETSQLHNALEENSNYLWLKVGRFYGTEAYSLIYVALPDDISDSCRIVDAKLNLITYRAGISTCSSNLTISAHEITSDWNQTNISDNKVLYKDELPEYIYHASDFMTLNDSSTDSHNKLYSLDITKIAQKWATGESVNRGILLKGENLPDSERYMRFYDSDNTLRNSDPCFTYSYRDTKGVEDYWTYTTMTAGRSGTAAVNNFNGNLIVTQNITGITGNKMPVSISLVYDSSSRTSNQYYFGKGWKSNFDMKICTSELEKFPFYLVDSDGTEHYFFGEDNAAEWKDEDGLGYTLKRDSFVYSNGYLLTDKNKNKTYFRSDGKLGKMNDTFGNSIIINYNSASKISSITDGAGRNYNFAYNSSGNVSSITNPANKTVSFIYDSNANLTRITYPDNLYTSFTYGTNGLSRVTGIDGTYTSFAYLNVYNHLYTIALEYYGSNGVLNTDYDFTYKDKATTVESDCDNTVNHTFQFDNFGKTTGVINNITSIAQYYEYGAPGGSTGTENKLLSASEAVTPSYTCYTDNDSYNNSSKWYLDPSSIGTIMSVDNSRGRNKAPSLKVQQTGEYGGGGGVIFDAGVLKGGYNYNFQAFINTNGVKLNSPGGIALSVYYYDTDGQIHYGSAGTTIFETFEDDWLSIDASIGLETDQHYYVSIGAYLQSPGTYWIDDLQIKRGTENENYNYINNVLFANNGNGWQYLKNGNTANITEDEIFFYEDTICVIYGSFNEKRSVRQTTNCTGKAGDAIVFGAKGLGHSAYTGENENNPRNKSVFRVRIEMSGPSGNATFTNDANIVNFNSSIETLQFVSGRLIAPIDFTSITFYFDYDYNTSYAMFTLPFIYKESYGQSYTYDSSGNVVSSKDLAGTEATFAYQDNNLSQMLDPSGTRYSYAYDENTNALIYANSSYGQLYAFTYDDYGNVLSSTVSAAQNSTQLSGNNTYFIRNVTTGNAMKSNGTALVNGTYATQNNSIRWKLVPAGETDVYYIESVNDADKYLTVKDGSSADKASIILSAAANSDSQKFKVTSNGDGTFIIKSKVSNYEKAIDSRDLNNGSSTELNKGMVQNTIDTTSGYQKWYFTQYVDNAALSEKMTSSATYTENGNYISTLTDSLGNTSSYQYNSDGTLDSTTDAKDIVTSYEYNHDSGALLSVTSAGSSNKYTYENDRIKTIETPNGTVYTFNYDAFGRNKSIQLNRKDSTAEPRTIATYLYNSEDYLEGFTSGSGNKLSKIIYGNGFNSFMFYDSCGRIRQINGASYGYNVNNNLTFKSAGWGIVSYKYDLAGRLINQTLNDEFSGSIVYSLSYKYLDQKNLLDKFSFSDMSNHYTTSFVYGDINSGQIADAVYGVKLNDTLRIGYEYDDLARQSARTLYTGNASVTKNYGYKTSLTGSESVLVDTVEENGYTYSYTYDESGNITSYTKKNSETNQVVESYVYQYDDKNQLIFAGTDTNNGTGYTYDSNGNILTKTDSSTNTTVNYGYTDPTWADLLTSYKGQTITYDEIGNPLTYRDGMSFTWEEGRQLSSVTKNGSVYNYYYDGEGYRSQKMVNNNSTQYTVIDGVIYGEVTYGTTGATQIYYYYDDGGRAYGFSYNGTMYYYQFNLQGDVTGIYNSNGQLVTEYKYDPWGKVLSVTGSMASTVGQANPIRYRGYYYDSETGFYFLQSRYYDPETGRFLNADSQLNIGESITGNNMFIYCANNPVNNIDPDGHSWKAVKDWFIDKYNKAKKAINKAVNWIDETIIKPISTFITNALEIEGGTGFGFAGTIEYEGMGIDAALKTDMPHIKVSNEDGYEEYTQTDISLTVDWFILEIGPHYKEYDGKKPNEFTWYEVKDTITVFSIGGAFFYGANFSVSLDYKYILNCVVKIFE